MLPSLAEATKILTSCLTVAFVLVLLFVGPAGETLEGCWTKIEPGGSQRSSASLDLTPKRHLQLLNVS